MAQNSNTARPRNVGPQDPNTQVEDPGKPRVTPEADYKGEALETGAIAKQQPGGKVNTTPAGESGTPPDHPGLGRQGGTSLPKD